MKYFISIYLIILYFSIDLINRIFKEAFNVIWKNKLALKYVSYD